MLDVEVSLPEHLLSHFVFIGILRRGRGGIELGEVLFLDLIVSLTDDLNDFIEFSLFLFVFHLVRVVLFDLAQVDSM